MYLLSQCVSTSLYYTPMPWFGLFHYKKCFPIPLLPCSVHQHWPSSTHIAHEELASVPVLVKPKTANGDIERRVRINSHTLRLAFYDNWEHKSCATCVRVFRRKVSSCAQTRLELAMRLNNSGSARLSHYFLVKAVACMQSKGSGKSHSR